MSLKPWYFLSPLPCELITGGRCKFRLMKVRKKFPARLINQLRFNIRKLMTGMARVFIHLPDITKAGLA